MTPDHIILIKALAVVIGGYAFGRLLYIILGDYDEF